MDKQHTTPGLTLGSLFDGIGGFPYAASFFGIEPIWASEIMPQAISVTQRILPDMEHVGDITRLNGATLPPVDIITFGSPCQGLSMAGRRLGFADERSGLFSEAVRIIEEMREATNGNQPRYAVWENVPGALSSNSGLDYQAVLEAFAKTEVPIPRSGKWANAGMVRSDGIDLAWCVYNAQHFGVPQRRRRIFLVCDFGGRSAGEILFIPKSLSGYFAARREAGQDLAGYAAGGAEGAGLSRRCGRESSGQLAGISDTAGTLDANYGKGPGMRGCVEREVILCAATGQSNAEILDNLSATLNCNCEQPIIYKRNTTDCLNPWDTQQSRIFTEDGLSPTLAGADGGGGRNPAGLVYCCNPSQSKVDVNKELAATLTCQHEQPFIVKSELPDISYVCEPNLARTLTARGDGSPNIDSGPNIVAVTEAYQTQQSHGHAVAVGVSQNQSGDVNIANTAYTLATNGNATGRNAPLVCENIRAFSLDSDAGNSMKSSNPLSGCRAVETARTLDTTNPCPSKSQGGVAIVEESAALDVYPEISGTLVASGAGMNRPGGFAGETDLCVVVPNGVLISNSAAIPINDKATRYSGGGDTRKDDGSGNGLGVGKDGDPAPTITSGDRHAVAAFCLQGNMIGRQDHNGPRGSGVNEDLSFTLTSTNTPAVASVDCRNYRENEELSGTLQAKTTQGYSLNYQNPIRSGYIVRRLLPVECERLQGYPDGWTEFGHDGKEISDTRRYQMLGNSVCVNVVAYIMLGIVEQFRREVEVTE
ncbi:MAG: DNA (cytosine-5-)-methyltransferase [Defluviitaleaceae bacterium]|nr:DNA (cytosine-5-)-methyltransferase [Defluviitaleaceae bacterium]